MLWCQQLNRFLVFRIEIVLYRSHIDCNSHYLWKTFKANVADLVMRIIRRLLVHFFRLIGSKVNPSWRNKKHCKFSGYNVRNLIVLEHNGRSDRKWTFHGARGKITQFPSYNSRSWTEWVLNWRGNLLKSWFLMTHAVLKSP